MLIVCEAKRFFFKKLLSIQLSIVDIMSVIISSNNTNGLNKLELTSSDISCIQYLIILLGGFLLEDFFSYLILMFTLAWLIFQQEKHVAPPLVQT